MEEKKVATSIDILINVGQFEHIQITKYAEKKIIYESSEEMIKKEDEVTSELVSDIIRTMRALPEKLGKKTNAIGLIEEKIQNKIPDWLANNPVPNLAREKFEDNQAKINVEIEVKKEKEDERNSEVADLIEATESKGGVNQKPTIPPPIDPPKGQNPTKDEKPIKIEINLNSDDLFDDADLFKIICSK